jgi:hypothetical protein
MIKKVKQFITTFNDPLGGINFGYVVRSQDEEATRGRGAEEVQRSDEEVGSRAYWYQADSFDEEGYQIVKTDVTFNKD